MKRLARSGLLRQSLVLMLCAFSVCVSEAKGDISAATPRLIYLRFHEDRDLDDKLILYLRAHLSPVIAVSVSKKKFSPTLPTKKHIAAVHAEIKEQDASAAVWVAPDDITVMLLVPEISSSPWPLVVSGETSGSSTWCESMAVLVMSDLAPLIPLPLGTASVAPAPKALINPVGGNASPAPDTDPEKIAKTTLSAQNAPNKNAPNKNAPNKNVPNKNAPNKNAPNKNAHEKPNVTVRSAKVPRQRLKGLVWIGGAVGYTPTWQVSEQSALHGVQVEVAIGVGPHLWISFQGDLAEKLSFAFDNQTATLRRWPFRALLHGGIPINHFTLAMGLGCVWAPTYLNDLPYPPANDKTGRVHYLWGLAGQVAVDYWVLSWLGFRLKAGVDIFLDHIRLTHEDRTVLHVRRVGATLFLGVTGRLRFRGVSR